MDALYWRKAVCFTTSQLSFILLVFNDVPIILPHYCCESVWGSSKVNVESTSYTVKPLRFVKAVSSTQRVPAWCKLQKTQSSIKFSLDRLHGDHTFTQRGAIGLPSAFEKRANTLLRTRPWNWYCWRITYKGFSYLDYSMSYQAWPREITRNGWD